MNISFRIFLFFTALLLFTNINAQPLSKKEQKELKEQMLAKIKTLGSRGQVDSLIRASYNQQFINDSSSLQKYSAENSQGGTLEMVVLDGDTLYIYNMAPFTVVDMQPYGDAEKDKQFRRLRWHVKKVYPYATAAAEKLKKYNEEIKTVKSNRQKKKLMKLREQALKEEFEDVIKDMSKTSGRVLIKLIDRETGESTYEIIKEMRGRWKAWTYQGVGKLYGADLKQRYNPETSEEDEMIERVVKSLIAEGENMR